MIIKKRRKDGVVQRYHTKPKKRLSKNVVIKFRMRQIEPVTDKRIKNWKTAFDFDRLKNVLDQYPKIIALVEPMDDLMDQYYNKPPMINKKISDAFIKHPRKEDVFKMKSRKDNIVVTMPRTLWNVLQRERILYFEGNKLVNNLEYVSYVVETIWRKKIKNNFLSVKEEFAIKDIRFGVSWGLDTKGDKMYIERHPLCYRIKGVWK